MDFINRFLVYLATEKRYSDHTILSYRNDLNQFTDFLSASFETEDIFETESLMVRSWVVSLKEADYSARSINRKLSSLRSFFKHGIRQGEVSKNPVIGVPTPKVEKRLPVFVEENAMQELLIGQKSDEIFGEDFSGLRDKLIVTLLYETGIRLSELIGISDGNINFHKSQVKVLGKRNKERLVPVGLETINLIRRYITLRDEKFKVIEDKLIVTNAGKTTQPKFVRNRVNYYLGMVSTLSKRSPHILRHSFATHMLNNGAQLNSVKELLGHASLAATQVYTHNTIEKLKDVHKKAHPQG